QTTAPTKPATSGQTTAPEQGASIYQPGQVDVYTGKGKRVAGAKADRRGFRFSLPPGAYRLRTDVGGDAPCWAKAEVRPGGTTRADLRCILPPPAAPPFRAAAVKDVAGDVTDSPAGGRTPPYADLLAAATKPGKDGVTLEFLTAAPVPATAPTGTSSRRHWAASLEQDGRTALVSLTGAKGAWTLRWAAKDPKTGKPVATGQVTTPVKPTISGPRLSTALGRAAPLPTAPIDFTKPYRIIAAESLIADETHSWADTAPRWTPARWETGTRSGTGWVAPYREAWGTATRPARA
ncbi:MAG TPA: hypothetical protein VFV66_09660, partial [Nonomuraea sp.]|nr:hypothetical protein [Nonomuraea sp.]